MSLPSGRAFTTPWAVFSSKAREKRNGVENFSQEGLAQKDKLTIQIGTWASLLGNVCEIIELGIGFIIRESFPTNEIEVEDEP